jgi:sugar O-acyltransferase (sialic acid O-acetyltransferase NeuD family)
VRVVLVGASNPETARQVRAARRQDPTLEFVGFLDNDPAKWGTEFVDLPVLGGFEHVAELGLVGAGFVNLITRDTRTRRTTTEQVVRLGLVPVSLVHPDVDVDLVEIGTGCYVQDHVVLQAGVRLGADCSLHATATVCHETTLGDTVFVAPGAVLAGLVTIGEGVFVGIGATVLPRISIGAWATIGAGAVVSRDVPPGATVVAVPSKVLPGDPDR